MGTITIFRSGMASVRLHEMGDGTGLVTNLYSRRRRHGDASNALSLLLAVADEKELVLILYPMPYGPNPDRNKDALIEFYRKFGFRLVIPGWLATMKRTPRKKNRSCSEKR